MGVRGLLSVYVKYILRACAHHDNDIALCLHPHVALLLGLRGVKAKISIVVPWNVHEEVEGRRYRIDCHICADALCAFQSRTLVEFFQSKNKVLSTRPMFLPLLDAKPFIPWWITCCNKRIMYTTRSVFNDREDRLSDVRNEGIVHSWPQMKHCCSRVRHAHIFHRRRERLLCIPGLVTRIHRARVAGAS